MKKNEINNKIGITFKDSKKYPIHKWYPYVEGFSAPWVRNQILSYKKKGMKIYDPFGGCGTTHLEASLMGIESYYSEVNPFMRFVLETKVNTVSRILKDKNKYFEEIKKMEEYINSKKFDIDLKDIILNIEETLIKRDYFEEDHYKKIKCILKFIKKSSFTKEVKDILILAISSIGVDSSNMTRRADLRRRRPNEYKNRAVDVKLYFLKKIKDIVDDIDNLNQSLLKTTKILENSKEINEDYKDTFDLVITSPPYANGTNYIRNTTIELLISECIGDESELKELKLKTVCGGISDAVKERISEIRLFDFIEITTLQLDKEAKDKRIPLMVRGYFSDMYKVLKSVYVMMKKGGHFILDIGDSKFYGVYIPVENFLIRLAEQIGFTLVREEVIAKRYSRDKTELKQFVLTFEK